MEQVRLLAAIGLSFLVLFVWSMFFNNSPEQDNQENYANWTETEEITMNGLSNAKDEISEIGETVNVTPYTSNIEHEEPREIIVNTPLFRMVFSERGGVIKSSVLKNYKEEIDINSQFKEIISEQLRFGNVVTYLSSSDPLKMQETIFNADLEGDYIEIFETTTLSFFGNDDSGRSMVKSFTFRPDSYLIDMNITIINKSDHTITDSVVLSLRDIRSGKAGYGFEGPSAFIDGQRKQFKTKDINSGNKYDGHIDWIATENRYFISSIIPSYDFNGHIELNSEDKVTFENKIVSRPFKILSENQVTFRLSLFMGPKSTSVLSTIGHKMDKAIYFGIFDFIAKPCLWFMNKIYSIIPNYGVAIILLTVCTKIVLWPLGSKGYKSMNEMKKLQPLIAEIRTKYKNNKQKMNQEIMALYRTYKVNPMGGCLPMILQIPVFFALYRMLYQAIELRHAPFILWINDLSAPDRLFNFGFSIPFMHPPYGIPVLTVIMGATMLIQQKMSPPPGDPTQAKMMMMMPIIFIFIFINFSSGLVLYWLVNNILSISQQYYIQKKST